MGKKTIKGSQAMGPFNNKLNKYFAKIILPRLTRIFMRGAETENNFNILVFIKIYIFLLLINVLLAQINLATLRTSVLAMYGSKHIEIKKLNTPHFLQGMNGLLRS